MLRGAQVHFIWEIPHALPRHRPASPAGRPHRRDLRAVLEDGVPRYQDLPACASVTGDVTTAVACMSGNRVPQPTRSTTTPGANVSAWRSAWIEFLDVHAVVDDDAHTARIDA